MSWLNKIISKTRRFWFCLVFFCLPVHAASNAEIEQIFQADEPPPGVVFEIIEDDPDDLEEVIDETVRLIERLRKHFPSMEFAVVSHGPELFALQAENQKEYAELHQTIRSLKKQDITTHVCETFAGWSGVTAEQFPDYVDVTPVGPVQIKNYKELGFFHHLVEKAEN